MMPQDIVFSCEEVLGTMKKLAIHKASSPGSAPAVGWKLLAEILAEPMTRFINGIFATGPLDIEAGLTTAWLCFLPKPNKANRKAGDLRPIALRPVPSKIITSLLRDRLQPYVDACVEGMPQFGYTKNRGTQEAIAIVAQHCKLVRDQVASQRLGIQDKHRGITRKSRKSCLGGAQLALDFSRAFDSMPRSCIQHMLHWAKVPEPLIIALLAWHEQTVYCFGEAGSAKGERCIRVTQGVKQGCQIAPALWTMFTCFVCDLINQNLGEKWCQQHLVGFADDTHLRWLLDSFVKCEAMCMDIDRIMVLFKSLHLQVNEDKSHLLVELRGSEAERWFRKRRFKLPKKHHQRLRRILQGKGGLLLSQRVRLWRICVQTSQMYGLDVIGVTEPTLKSLHTQSLVHLRAIAKSPRHITRESDRALLDRLGLQSPAQCILLRMDGLLQRHAKNHALPCFRSADIHNWVQQRRNDLITLMQPMQSAQPVCQLIPVPPEAPQFACQVCGAMFSSLHHVKSHEGRARKLFAPKDIEFDRALHSTGGLPNCRLCFPEMAQFATAH